MTRTLVAFAATLLASTAVVSSAEAAPIVYTISGTYAGTLNGNAFSTFATFTGLGDTATATPGFSGSTVVTLSSLTAFADNTLFTILGTNYFANSPKYIAAGFFNPLYGAITGARSKAFASYDAVSDFGPLSVGEYAKPISFKTDKGNVIITKTTGITFSAAVPQFASIAAVPEPATWMLMIAGFGAIGAAMRRRTGQVSTTVAYA